MSMDDMIEAMARKIASALGDDLDNAFENKSEWNAARGGEPFRDINMPFKCDYLDAARAALIAALPMVGEEMAKLNLGFVQARDSEWDTGFNDAKSLFAKAIRTHTTHMFTSLKGS